jgi:hypothetical protein
MEKNLTAEKIWQCARCPFFNRCPKQVSLSGYCPRKEKKVPGGDPLAHTSKHGLKQLSLIWLN